MGEKIKIQPITIENFKPYGDILDCSGSPDKLINNNFCERYDDKAVLDFQNGRAGISIFNAQSPPPTTYPALAIPTGIFFLILKFFFI